MDRISRQSDFLVRFTSTTTGVVIEGLFSRKSGGKITKPSTKVRDGGNLVAQNVPGFVEFEDIELSRPFVATRDAGLYRQIVLELSRGGGSVAGTVSITPTDADLIPLDGDSEAYVCDLIGAQMPEVDADSADAGRFTITLGLSAAA